MKFYYNLKLKKSRSAVSLSFKQGIKLLILDQQFYNEYVHRPSDYYYFLTVSVITFTLSKIYNTHVTYIMAIKLLAVIDKLYCETLM